MELTVPTVAQALGVTDRRVQRMVRDGDLQRVREVGRSVMISGESVRRQAILRRSGVGRAWAPKTAWAAIDLLSTGTSSRLSASETSRLKNRILSMSAAQLSAATRARNTLRFYLGAVETVPTIVGDVVPTGLSFLTDQAGASAFGLSANVGVGEVYVRRSMAETLDAQLMPSDHQGSAGRVCVRLVDELPSPSEFLVALDLMDSVDTRIRSAGEEAVEQAMDRFRDVVAEGRKSVKKR